MASAHLPGGTGTSHRGEGAGGGASSVAELEAEITRLQATEEASRQREQQLTQHNLVLMTLSRSAAIEAGDMAAAFQEITLAAAHTLNVERASIWLFTLDRLAIKCADLYQRTPNRHGDGLELKAADFPSYFRAIEDNRTLAADDARNDPRTCEFTPSYLTPLGITSMLDAPVRRGGRLIGVICHEHVGPSRAWSLEDQAFAGSMADFVALTMQAHERAEALRSVRANERQLRQIIDLVPHLIMAKDVRGQILLCNKATAEAYGTTVEALIGRSQWDVHPRRDEAAGMLSDDVRVIDTARERLVPEERFTDIAGATRILQTTRIPFLHAATLQQAVLSVSIDITQRKQDERQKETMIQELDHRVKNNLAVVQSIAEHTVRSSPTMEEFSDAFAGRLRALAITHEMLARTRWEGADLRAMVERLTEPYRAADGSPRVTMTGESLRLPAPVAPSVCMMLHELATNAAKHGALASRNGDVTIDWQREMRDDGSRRVPWLHIEWTERCGRGSPPIKAPARPGFGTTLIEQTADYQLQGHARLDFQPAGLAAVIEFPLEAAPQKSTAADGVEPPRSLEQWSFGVAAGVSNGEKPTNANQPAAVGSSGEGGDRTGGRRVLVVEDDLLVAQSIASHLVALGCEIIGPASTSEAACALVKSRNVDAAILDINLSAGTSAPVARALAGRKTPFMFVTGYSSLKTLPDDLRGQRVLCKPVDRETLRRAITELAGV